MGRATAVRPSVVPFVSYAESVPRVLDAAGAASLLSRQNAILIKPNLVEAVPPPVTTPVECVEAVIAYCRACSKASLVVAEGCGAASYDTELAFDKLGYAALSKRTGVPLLNLNTAPTILLRNAACRVFPAFHMPAVAMDHFVISVPVLKAHSLAKITGTLKNMMGFAPPAHYQQGGHWKKSAFHGAMHEAIRDLNRHRTPDLTLLDARVGLAEYHLGGAECSPRVMKLVAGADPVEVDRLAASLLGFDWRSIPHLT
ncbi:MAG: DUF362 domain-containing protein [Candidatus Coatesbacteria bacterium]|mgnify:FL=1